MTRPMKKRMKKLLGNVIVPAVAGLLAVIELASSPGFTLSASWMSCN